MDGKGAIESYRDFIYFLKFWSFFFGILNFCSTFEGVLALWYYITYY